MTHLAWKEVAEGAQRRAEQRCAADGHDWQRVDQFGYACRWCLSVETGLPPEGPPNWRSRALSHATVVRALLAVKDLEPDSAGAAWLAEARETLKLADAENLPTEVRS